MYDLGGLRFHLREALKEPNPDDSLWTDQVLNSWLNEGAFQMAEMAQPEECIYSFATVYENGSTSSYAREYEMPAGTNDIFGVSLWNGMNHDLHLVDQVRALQNNQITGVPTRFYIRKSRQVAETSAAGIAVTKNQKNQMRFYIGLDPKPSGEFPVSVFHYADHFYMHNDADVPIIPPAFRRGIIYYAKYLAHESDDMEALANLARSQFNNYVELLKAKRISAGQQMEFPKVRIRDEDERDEDYYEVSRIPD